MDFSLFDATTYKAKDSGTQSNAELPPPAVTDSPLGVPNTSNTNKDSSSADSFILYSHEHMEQLASQFEWYWDNSDSDETTEWTHQDEEQPDSDNRPCITNEVLQSLMDQELPANHRTQVEKLHPVEEDLMILMKKNRLPIQVRQKVSVVM